MKLKYNTYDLYPFGAHVKIVKLIGTNKKVLEVGCSTGYISKRLKENGCTVVGIEVEEKSAEVARRYCDDVIVGDVEIFKAFAKKPKPNLKIGFIDSEGWNSMGYYANAKILKSKKVKIPIFVIFDGDTEKEIKNRNIKDKLVGQLNLDEDNIITLGKNSIFFTISL